MENIYIIVVGVDGFGNDIQVCEDFGYFTSEEKVKEFVKALIYNSIQCGDIYIGNFTKPDFDENDDEVFYEDNEVDEFIEDMLKREEGPLYNIYSYLEVKPNKTQKY